jgi:cytochrome c peroxidase
MLMNRSSFLKRLSSVLLVALLSIDVLGLQAQESRWHLDPKTNHIGTVIVELMAGANGDSSIQFIEMEAPCGENSWGPENFGGASNAMLVFFDAQGNETYRYKFPNNPPCGNGDALIATQAFASLPGAPTPEFIIPPVISPVSGKVCFKGNTAESFTAFGRNFCVSYGSFTGLTETNSSDGGPSQAAGSPAAALPITATTSLNFAEASPETNANFSLGTATPENHLGATFTIPAATQAVIGGNLFNKETFGGNGRTCASCHVSTINLGLSPANIQTRFGTLSSTFDPLFLGETTMNLNTLVVTSPVSTGTRGKRDFEGIITGSGGGTAKVLTKLVAQGTSTLRYLVYGGLSPQLAGTISDTNGNSATFSSITAGTLACSAGGSGTATCTNQLESPLRTRTSIDTTNFPQGRSLILENIDGFTVPHTSNHVFRKSPNLDNAKLTSPFGLSGLVGGAATLGDFATGAVKQHFPRTINRVNAVDFRLPTAAETAALDAFQQTRNVPADENFDLNKFATTTAQIAGRAAFFGSAKCSKCHSGTVLATTDGSISGKSGNANFNTGVDALPINVAIDLLPTEQSGMREFNTPALFNVKNHSPFFHNGAVATVHQAVEFYSTSAFQNSPAATQIGGLTFANPSDIDNIAAFLEGLTVRPYALTAGPLSFGSRNITAGPTGTQAVTITNTSGSTITLTSPFVRLTGTDSTEFVINSHNVTGTLGAGASATANISFDPSTSGAKTAVVELLADVPSGVALTGTGIGPPAITNVSPNSGTPSGGRTVTITGTDLLGATVTFGGSSAGIVSTSATTAVVTTPAHALGTVNVAATTGNGTGTATNAYTYAACAGPTINTQPQSGSIRVGNSVNLSVSATGTSPTFQWFIGTTGNTSTPIVGATASSVTVTPGVTTSFWVRVSDQCGDVNSNTATVTVAAAAPAASFFLVSPCRVLDTRGGGAIQPGISRNVLISGLCGVPSDATALAVNITVVNPADTAFATFYPGPAFVARPNVSTINFIPGRTLANNARIALGVDGSINIFNAGAPPLDVLIDIAGYFK